jgi:hypothetical protein
MARTIQVFVKNKEVISGHFETVEFSSPGHPCTAKPITAPILESVLPETHKEVIEIAEKVAKERQMKVKVCDLSSKMGKLKALFKGVRETPTIVIENHKISGQITEEKLLSILK